MGQTVPYRQCVACRTRRPQAEMLRLWRAPDGRVSLSHEPRTGRGAYCCPLEACMRKAVQKKLYQRSLRATATVADPEELLRQMATAAARLA